MAFFLPSGRLWSDAVIGTTQVLRIVAGNAIVPGASPCVAPHLMACLAMACAGVHSSVLAAFALAAVASDLTAASSGFEETSGVRLLACAYTIAAATVTEYRVAEQLMELRVGGYRALSLASRTMGGDVYYSLHDVSRVDPEVSRFTAERPPSFDSEAELPEPPVSAGSPEGPPRPLPADSSSSSERG
ncbi:unnamed protein product [Prorocentrum cordatum]|uniref:Protein RFT1 homolog n=1 Tax=Prorocentrum cordatum TaxID=2364126 RepID=A0ABN9WUM0_9DINO|nr:unnamed protein product [Polarella glacialis]